MIFIFWIDWFSTICTISRGAYSSWSWILIFLRNRIIYFLWIIVGVNLNIILWIFISWIVNCIWFCVFILIFWQLVFLYLILGLDFNSIHIYSSFCWNLIMRCLTLDFEVSFLCFLCHFKNFNESFLGFLNIFLFKFPCINHRVL